jgi:hypothetical protein
VTHAGEILVHRNRKAAPAPLLKAVAPYRDGLVVAGACVFTWYWLAALCAQAGLPVVLGHALSMQAIHGGKATNATIDAQKIAALRRGGMLPQASVSPAEMGATRDLLRRRTHLMRKRAELLAHVQHTHSQDHLPAIGKKIASKATRAGVAARLAEPAVQKRVEVDVALITDDDQLLGDIALSMVQAAKHHDAHTLYLGQTVPGRGKSLSRVLRYDIHDMGRCPRVPDLVSDGRLVKCATESAGKRLGTSGHNIGNGHLKWAFSETAVLFRRTTPAGQTSLARVTKQHGKGKAVPILAHKLARAVYDRLKRQTAVDMDKFLHG